MADCLTKKGYDIISGGTDNHCMLIDLTSKGISGKQAENSLVQADITANKNMVPFDTKSPFVTSGIRFGTPAITTRGVKENTIPEIVEFIDQILTNHENENLITKIKSDVNEFMSGLPLFKK